MAKQPIALIFLLLAVSGSFFVSGCHSRTADPANTLFKDERAMRLALRGSWILKEYEDSIDAGLTPKLLEYMLVPRSCISYDMRQMHTSGFRPAPHDMLFYDNNDFEKYGLNFDITNNKVLISIITYPEQAEAGPDTKPGGRRATRPDTLEVDTAEIVIDGFDTILKLHRDSLEQDFVKYQAGNCGEIDVYSHLANSKYIAGKYYALSDTGRTHHIIFTKCGNVEGVEYIDPLLKGRVAYNVAISCFYTGPDEIEFFNPDYKMGMGFDWQVIRDSLILTNGPGSSKHIVLVKAQ